MKYCPNCGSNHIHLCGHTKAGSQRYYCHTCGQKHTENPKQIFKNKEMIQCPACKSVKIGKKGFTRKGTQRYVCKECNKRFVIEEQLPVLSENDKQIIRRYYFGCHVSITILAKHLHHSFSTISKYIKEVQATENIKFTFSKSKFKDL